MTAICSDPFAIGLYHIECFGIRSFDIRNQHHRMNWEALTAVEGFVIAGSREWQNVNEPVEIIRYAYWYG